MTKRTVTTWTCRRCGAEETVVGTGQPKDWSRVYFAVPPEHSEHQALGDLCNPCGGYLVSFVYGTEVEDMRRDGEVARMMAEIESGVPS